MQRFLLLFLGLATTTMILAQSGDLPPNPEPGKCYVKCITPDVYETREVEVMVRPAYKKLTVAPAEYKIVEERVEVKPETKEFVYHPAELEWFEESYVSEEGYNELTVVPAQFGEDSEVVEVEPAQARWEYRDYEDCPSDNPGDCRMLCWVEYDPVNETVPVETLAKDASTTKDPVAEQTATIRRQRVVREAYVEEITIPAEYETITRRVLVKDETTVEQSVPAEYTNVTQEVLVKKGGATVWEEVECELTDYNLLPIFYELGSARLTSESKRIIDQKLYSLMTERPNIRIELSSHTDSRGSAASNLNLSERRAQSVVNYLIGKGINASRLVARGFGETRLKNRCSDGVSCTEREHQQNRRTEFRVLSY